MVHLLADEIQPFNILKQKFGPFNDETSLREKLERSLELVIKFFANLKEKINNGEIEIIKKDNENNDDSGSGNN